MAESLTEKTTKGVAWNSIDRIANYGIGFIVGVVLARLLSPEEYGLIGIVAIFTAIFNVILDSGLSTALIRKDKVTENEYCTVFITNLLLSFILTAILFFCARPISFFFNRPELVPYIKVMSFILIINALSITQQVRLTKQIDFKTQTKISIISHTSSGVIGIVMAFAGCGVWALVAQQMSSRFFTSMLLWIYSKWMPRLFFSWISFKELFGFGWKLLLAQVVYTIWNQIYQTVIGKLYSPTTLGQYTRAQQYSYLCSGSIGDVVLKVSLPVMSCIQDDDERLLKAYRIIIKTTMLVTTILMLGMAASARSLIYVLIGEKWLPCAPMMQILCFSYMIHPLQQININMLAVQGRSDIQLMLQIVKCILSIGPILFGIFVGIYWMLGCSVVASWIGLLLNSYYSGKKFHYSWWNQIKDILPSVSIAFLVAGIMFLISMLQLSPYVMLPLQMLVGAVVAIVLCEWIGLEEYCQIKKIILNYYHAIIKKDGKGKAI